MRRLVLLASLCSFTSYAAESFMPENTLHLHPPEELSSMTELQFNAIVDEVINLYEPEVKSYGANLVSDKRWDDETVNAYAMENGSQWMVAMFGGLARRPEVTPDGFSLVVCHEVGHHLGGFPFYQGNWAAAEGEADYFATQACGKKLWGVKDNSEFERGVDSFAKAKCDAQSPDKAKRQLCYRVSQAGFSLAKLLGALGNSGVPSFANPDKSVVAQTNSAHPAAQCRLDTYFQGDLCQVSRKDGHIPKSEAEAAQSSCAAGLGSRPRCWYAPGSKFEYQEPSEDSFEIFL